ncbi:MAG: hypothetical protein ABIQ52_05815 [Vicinamibacterales bacterium]
MGSGQIPGSTDGSAGTIVIDDGTLARTESPDPGPVGLDAPGSGGGAGTPNVAARVIGFARRQHGSRIGDGECFALADRALHNARARSASDFGTVEDDADYVWGTSVTLSDLQPGDIIQMRDYRFDREVSVDNPDGSGSTNTSSEERPHHTAIVETVNGNGGVTVLEQNAPRGSAVRRTELFFSGSTSTSGRRTTTITVQGSFWFYRPQPR